MLKARAFSEGIIASAIVMGKVIKYEWMDPVKVGKPQPGIAYKYYEPTGKIDMINSFKDPAVESGIVDHISIDKKRRADKFAFQFDGKLYINKDGIYSFYTASDDGSKLWIDGVEIVDNDGDHGTVEKSGRAALRKEYHIIKVSYFDSGGDNSIKVMIQVEGGVESEIQSSILFH